MMHLVFLGIMKKLIAYWLTGDNIVRFGRLQISEVGRRMKFLKTQIPQEFQRKPRSIQLYILWKATEFRLFLFYYGPLIMRGILNQDYYKHFLLLHAGCRLLCAKRTALVYTVQAKRYLHSFFNATKLLYGMNSAILNVHNILHLADDVTNFGVPLSKISAFPFESYLGKLRSMIRGPKHVIAQLCRRLFEIRFARKQNFTCQDSVNLRKQTAIYKSLLLTTNAPNNVASLQTGQILKINAIRQKGTSFYLEGNAWTKKGPLYTYPFASDRYFGMAELVDCPSKRIIAHKIQAVDQKMMHLHLNFKDNKPIQHFVIPIMH